MPTFHVTRELNNYFFSGGFRAAVIRVLITGIAVFLAVMIVPGLEVDSLGAGLPRVVVNALALHRTARVLRAATHGRSVWEIGVPLAGGSAQPVIASILPYDRYLSAETFLSLSQVPGRFGAMFQSPEQARAATNDLRRAQAEARVRCF